MDGFRRGEAGGRPEKLGNRYEGLWVARQLLRVLIGELRSVRVEAIGDDELGVDLWTTGKDGFRSAEQCKRDNGRQGVWKLPELQRRGILDSARHQLERGPAYTFTFVSGVDAPELRIISDRARRSGEDVNGYITHIIGDDVSNISFEALCKYWLLNSADSRDQATAFHLLRRIHVHTMASGTESWRDVEMIARQQAAGDPRIVIEILTAFAQDRFNQELDALAVRKYLLSLGIQLRDLAHDDRIAPRIEQLRQEFEEAGTRLLVGGELIPRQETETVLATLNTGNAPRLIIVHGPQGDGKSGVSLELSERLAASGRPILPIRLDVRDPGVSAEQFGKNCGLSESPALCLQSIVTAKPGVLLIDQLDAIRWTIAHAGAAWESVAETLDQARCGGLDVVLVCRSFDLNEDVRFKSLAARRGTTVIAVGPLTDATIDDVVRKHGCDPRNISARQRQLLRSVQRLRMWVAIKRPNADFQTATEMMRAYWKQIREQVENNGFGIGEFEALISRLLALVQSSGTIAAPVRILDQSGKLADFLKSLGVLSVEGGRVRFGHQSYLDYLIAESVVTKVASGAITLAAWIKGLPSQSLLQREQIRQALAIVRDDTPAIFTEQVESILNNAAIRFHVKQVALQVLGAVEEVTPAELDLAKRLDADPKWKPHVAEQVWFRRRPWLRALANDGTISNMLASNETKDVFKAIWLLRALVDEEPAIVATALRKYTTAGGEWPKYIASVVQFARDPAPVSLNGIITYLVEKGALSMHSRNFVALAKHQPHRYLRLFLANINTWASEQDANNPARRARDECPSDFVSDVVDDMKQMAAEAPGRVWDATVPLLIKAAEIRNKDRKSFLTPMDDRVLVNQEIPKIKDGVFGLADLLWICAEKLSASDPDGFWRRWDSARTSDDPSIRRFLVASLAFVQPAQAEAAIDRLLSDAEFFEAGLLTREHPWRPAKEAIVALASRLNTDAFRRLQDFILRMEPTAGERGSEERRLENFRSKGMLYANSIGYRQLALLAALPKERLSPEAQGLFGVLNEKFGYIPRDRHEDAVPPPEPRTIPDGFAAKATDAQWLAWIRAEHGLEKRLEKRPRNYWDRRFSVSTQLFARAKLDPDRFAAIAATLPLPGARASVSTILRAISENTTPTGAPEHWQPVGPVAIESLVAALTPLNDPDQAKMLSWMVERRHKATWGPVTVAELCRLAVEHSDPDVGHPGDKKKNIDRELASDTINDTRAVAVRAIGTILYSRPELWPIVSTTLTRASTDPAPSVRAAVINASLPLLNFQRDSAICLVITACTGTEDHVLACDDLNRFLGHALHTHAIELRPLLEHMLASSHGPAVSSAAGCITGIWLQKGLLQGLAVSCQRGNTHMKQGVAEVLSTWLGDSPFTEKCVELLPPYFSDSDIDVRKAAATMFREQANLSLPVMPKLAATFVESPAFLDEPGRLLFDLDQYIGPLVPYLDVADKLCQAFATGLAEPSRDMQTSLAGDATHLGAFLLKLYEQSEGRTDVRERCLDMWDQLLEARVGLVKELTQALDR